jgi:hypothetical protein
MWEDSVRDLYHGSGQNGRALRQYLNVIEQGRTPTAKQARAAFNSVRGSFVRRVDAAIARGETFPGYTFDEIHHWNWPMSAEGLHALDPRMLFPVSEDVHALIHTRTTIGPIIDPMDIYFQPINPLHSLDLDLSWPLAPRPQPRR